MADKEKDEPPTAEDVMADLGVDRVTAGFIAALVAGKVKGDVVIVRDGDDGRDAPERAEG